MKHTSYPLYVRARDLAGWLASAENTRAAGAHRTLWEEIGRAGRELLEAVALALSLIHI